VLLGAAFATRRDWLHLWTGKSLSPFGDSAM